MNIILRRSLTGVAVSPWNQWQNVRGLGGRMRVESVAECSWNTQLLIIRGYYQEGQREKAEEIRQLLSLSFPNSKEASEAITSAHSI